MTSKKFVKSMFSVGSALILTMVLTSLLAIVGVLFLMMARVNKITASSISKNKELDSAVDMVIAKISEELALDIPRKDPNGLELSEYYDYPGQNDRWLASLEPYREDPNDPNSPCRWRQISDVTGYLARKAYGTQDVNVAPVGLSTTDVVREYPIFSMDSEGRFLKVNSDGSTSIATYGVSADADGDGIADSKWIQLDDITSSGGKPVYAAIRIVDNGGMINVNTAYKFDPNDPNVKHIDGSTQMQINLGALARNGDDVCDIHNARCGAGVSQGWTPAGQGWDEFQNNVVWRFYFPAVANYPYLPFDISDELELRYRYCITSKALVRLENVWDYTIGDNFNGKKDEPYAGGTFGKLKDWCTAVTDPYDVNNFRRHYLTTCNMDRIIDPNGDKMLNINTVTAADINIMYNTMRKALTDYDPNFADVNKVTAQIAVNLIDFRDSDSNVTAIDVNSVTYYGFERPCIYISEVDYNSVTAGDPPTTYRAYAVELYKPYAEDGIGTTGLWQLNVNDVNYDIEPWPANNKEFYVIRRQESPAGLPVDVNAIRYDLPIFFTAGSDIKLQRRVYIPQTGQIKYITVDSTQVPAWLVPLSDGCHSLQRDISKHKCIRRLWDPNDSVPTLGSVNDYNNGDPNYIQAHPANAPFTNVGEIGMIFRRDAYEMSGTKIGPNDTEADVLVDLNNPNFQQVFKYLTVWPPSGYVSDPNEARVKGRININTAPWFVLAQLPWVSQRKSGYNSTALAEAIVAYRDKLDLSSIFGPDYRTRPGAAGFENIGQLCDVNSGSNQFRIDYYSLDYESDGTTPKDQAGYPDLTTVPPDGDGAANDFEERDLIFARISNLVTVRSDVFTAYILVRIGTDGPQKRVIAIFDRSDVYPAGGKINVRAVQPVADPR